MQSRCHRQRRSRWHGPGLPSRQMELFAGVDWGEVLLPRTPLLETIVRGAVTYLALFLLLRVTTKREAAGTSISTLLVLVLIADAAQNAMADDYRSIADGLLLVGLSSRLTML